MNKYTILLACSVFAVGWFLFSAMHMSQSVAKSYTIEELKDKPADWVHNYWVSIGCRELSDAIVLDDIEITDDIMKAREKCGKIWTIYKENKQPNIQQKTENLADEILELEDD